MPGPRRELRVFRPTGASLIRRKPPTYHFAETCGFRRLGWKSRTAHIQLISTGLNWTAFAACMAT